MTIPLLPGNPPELVVLDHLSPCPYLPGRVARMPLRLPVRMLEPGQLEVRLAAGDRRQGAMLYRTACPACRACEPIRLDVTRFRASGSQRRIFQRGERVFRVEVGPPRVDTERVALYNAHKCARGLGDGQPPIGADGYREFLVNTCCESFELAYYVGDELAAVAVVDRGSFSLSAVYCHYSPRFARFGPGTYSIMKQVELCQRWGLRHLYLGLYIAESSAMQYKARYLPHERLIDGEWRELDAAAAAARDSATRQQSPVMK
ncbi:MAG: arginyltransferase [Sorangiineae bacterium]|nr:arginyltransferase [Polyangiaceae bacterium]MEB2323250.1 arginyltransferase [Sorangiineae bacterium]